MKTIKLLFVLIAAIFTISLTYGQQQAENAKSDNKNFLISLRAGYDLKQWYNNDMPYIDYKGGLMGGISLDYYWKYFGIGIDGDYLRNRPQSTYPTDNLWYTGVNPMLQVTGFSLIEESISRWFYGIGPGIRYINPRQNFSTQFHVRAGLAHIKGGLTELTAAQPIPLTLNYHPGYNHDFVFSGKAQLKFTYFPVEWLGFDLGAYYLHHFGFNADTSKGIPVYMPVVLEGELNLTGKDNVRGILKHDISSIGAFAGVTFRFGGKKKAKAPEGPCLTCIYGLTVTAKDKYTGEILPNTDVAMININGEVTYTGKTNSFGVVTFSNVVPEAYSIEGILHEVKLDPSAVNKEEYEPNKTIQKEILYADRSFIIQGRTFICNTTTPLPGVTVILENTERAFRKSTVTDAQGRFILHLPEMGLYTLYGKKENYFSQIEEINAANYDRDKNLFVKLELCAQEIECDKNVKLENIHYDLDKFFIREDAKPELNKVVQFMLDNPGVKVEIGSHTDSRASDAYNQTLSQNRANAAVDYIVSKGVERSRINAVGYGESRLLNHCADGVTCTEAEHQMNRRTEFKVICP